MSKLVLASYQGFSSGGLTIDVTVYDRGGKFEYHIVRSTRSEGQASSLEDALALASNAAGVSLNKKFASGDEAMALPDEVKLGIDG